jgi:glycosyltransferase involved in cell wall biosynthesis
VHADFIGGIASKLAGINKIIWNIRYSNLDIGIIKLSTYFLIKILSLLSFVIPKKIVVVSKRGLKNCEDLGYCVSKLKLIHNGYKPFVFKNNNQKVDFRKKYKIKNNVAIIGSIARYDPTKDHENLFKALSIVKKKTNFICLLFGSNISKKNIILINQIKKFQLSGSVRLLGSCNNILQYAQSFDLHILSSLTEGFPNVVAETMTCGIPNIVTNVGDSSLIVGKTGWIVPPQNHVKLANIIQKALSEIGKNNWKKRCKDSRIRINKKFGISKMIESYNLIWSKVYNSKK